jgi:hypothetical protein
VNDVGAIESASLCTTIGRRLAVALQYGVGFIFLVTAALKSDTPGRA